MTVLPWLALLHRLPRDVLAVPLAALGLLDPLISAAATPFSSVFVATNSLRLGHRSRLAIGGVELTANGAWHVLGRGRLRLWSRAGRRGVLLVREATRGALG